MTKFKEFMEESKQVNRWFILKVAMVGAFAGATLAVVYMIGVAI